MSTDAVSFEGKLANSVVGASKPEILYRVGLHIQTV